MKKKIGLYFGTFNPIHIGHLIIANYMAEFSNLSEIWLVVTPHNPFKKKSTLLDNHHRLEMVYMACEGYEKLKPSDVEFKLPQPNYTATTLAELEDKHLDKEFSLIMGEDNLMNFHKWKNFELILEKNDIYVYPRLTKFKKVNTLSSHPRIHKIDAPIIEISSTFIREAVKTGKNIQPMLPLKVWDYIELMNFYK